jgi:hypothetical protein
MPAVQYSDTVNTIDSSCDLIFNKKINILKLLFLLLFKVVWILYAPVIVLHAACSKMLAC